MTLNLDPEDVAKRRHGEDEGDHARAPVRPAGCRSRAPRARPADHRGRGAGFRRRRVSRRASPRPSASSRPRTSSRSATAASSSVNDAELARPDPDAPLPRLAGQEGLRADRLQLAPRRGAGRDAARSSCRISTGWNAARREAAARYAELGLGEIAELPADEPGHVYHMYCVRSSERDRLAAALLGGADRLRVLLPAAAPSAARAALPRLQAGRPAGDREGGAGEPLPADVGRDLRGAAGRGRRRCCGAPRRSSRRDYASRSSGTASGSSWPTPR